MGLCVAPIDCIVTLQDSGKWPDDVEAMRKLSAALYLCMANCLNGDQAEEEEAAQLKFVAKAFPDHIQVLGLGYAFRVRIWNEREVRLLRQQKRKPEADALELARFHRAQHTAAISALAHKFPSMGEALRLCKQWTCVHFLAAHAASVDGERGGGGGGGAGADGLSEEAVELLVAHCYTSALPFAPPSTPLAGFLRFLWLLASTDWEVSALIVDLSVASEEGSRMTSQAYRECQDAAEQARCAGGQSRRPVPVCLCTPADQGGVRWTQHGLSPMLWGRAVALARDAISCAGRGLARGKQALLWASLERRVSDFDVVIRLKAGASLLKVNGLGAQAFKNTRRKLQASLLVGLSPVHELLRRLREAYGRYALFWADALHVDTIVALWLPHHSSGGALSVAHAENTFPLVISEVGGSGGGGGGYVVPDTVTMLCGFKRLGEGLVSGIEVLPGARVVQ